MIYMGIDIGGATRNGICIIDENEKILYCNNIPFNAKSGGKGNHRRFVAAFVAKLIDEYKVTHIVLERVKMHRGNRLSKLDAIVSLSKATGAIQDYIFHKDCKLYDCETVSWKAKVLGKRNGTKEDAVQFVKNRYDIDVVHDTADAICEAIYLKRYLNTKDGKFHDITES